MELARDEEARSEVEGADLAAGIMAATRLEASGPRGVVSIASPGNAFRSRIERLLAPLPPVETAHRAPILGGCLFVGLTAALVLGARCGESLVRQVLGWRV